MTTASASSATDDRPFRSRRQRQKTRGRNASAELRLWLGLADAVIDSVERLAWDVRSLVDTAANALNGTQRQLRGLGNEATSLRGRAARLHKTGWMLTQIATGYRLFSLRAAFVGKDRASAMLAALHEESARRFSRVSAEQGGAFLKVGQLLSARADLLPEVWVSELSKLQDAAPSVDFEHLRATLERELGGTLSEIFAEIDEQAIAAASIGQVHRALTHLGQTVAVKVQRPGIGSIVEADLDLLEIFLDALRPNLPPADYETITAEVRAAVCAELDYGKEARVTRHMADFFAEVEGVLVPEPVAGLCTPSVLTTSFMQGRKITVVLDELRERADRGDTAAHAELSELLGRLLGVYLRQVLQAGLFQADPHPGNFLVTDDGQLVLLDFGCSRDISQQTRRCYLDLVRAFLGRDKQRMSELFAELGFATRSGDPETLHAFTEALLGEIGKAARSKQIEWPDRDSLVQRAMALLQAQQDDPVVQLPSEFVMLARVFGTLGGLFGHYRPDIDYARHVLPVLSTALAMDPAGR